MSLRVCLLYFQISNHTFMMKLMHIVFVEWRGFNDDTFDMAANVLTEITCLMKSFIKQWNSCQECFLALKGLQIVTHICDWTFVDTSFNSGDPTQQVYEDWLGLISKIHNRRIRRNSIFQYHSDLAFNLATNGGSYRLYLIRVALKHT